MEKRLVTGLSLKLGQLLPGVAKNTIHKISGWEGGPHRHLPPPSPMAPLKTENKTSDFYTKSIPIIHNYHRFTYENSINVVYIIYTMLTGSHYDTWRKIKSLSLYLDLSLQITHTAQESLATPPGSTSPTLLEQRSESAMRQDVRVFTLLWED